MTKAAPRQKITYATLRNDNEELHALYEAGIERARARLGGYHQNWVGGSGRDGDGVFELRSPIDHDILVGTFARGTRRDVRDAVAAARAAQPAWRATGWRDRLAVLRRAADLISERQMEYAAMMAIEVGKSRLEALGEVEESADLIRYYADVFERNNGFDHPMDNLGDPSVRTRSILRPYGVFAVISPFNFPMALAAGPTAGALMAGNAVIFKPASASALSGVVLAETYRDAGLPDGVFDFVMGPGDTVGQEIQENPGIDGIVFTGSYEVGMTIFRTFSKTWPKPCIVEMGGKNPAIVTATADLEEAASGIARSAFGFGGQKCSANSRVYVDRRVHDDLVRLLVREAEAITIGDPLQRTSWLGPIIDERAVARYLAAVAEARRDGRVLAGGERLADGDLARGYVRGADGGRAPAPGPPPLPGRAVRAVHGRPGRRQPRRVDPARQRERLRPHGRGVRGGSVRGGPLPRRDRVGRPLREPPRRRDHRRVAGRPAVRRLEGFGLDRQGRPQPLLSVAVHARAEPHHRRLIPGPRAGRGSAALPRRCPSAALPRGRLGAPASWLARPRRAAERPGTPDSSAILGGVSSLHKLYASAHARPPRGHRAGGLA